MVCFLDGFVARFYLVSFVGNQMMVVIFFWDCTFPPLVEIRENPEFHDLMRMDKAGYLVESALGGYSSGLIAEWGLPDGYDQVEVASLVPDHPNVWTDGSLVLDQVTGVSSFGAGFFCSPV